MSGTGTCITIRVKNRLGELLRRPGGVAKEEAVTDALQRIESLREEYVKAIPNEIELLEAILADTRHGRISSREICKLLNCADRLLVLSGTFGYPLLDAVVKSFCDLGAGMIEKNITSVDALLVHLRAMRLVCPGQSSATEEEAKDVLNELSKIHAYFRVA
jgi:hypothetical protein